MVSFPVGATPSGCGHQWCASTHRSDPTRERSDLDPGQVWRCTSRASLLASLAFRRSSVALRFANDKSIAAAGVASDFVHAGRVNRPSADGRIVDRDFTSAVTRFASNQKFGRVILAGQMAELFR